MCCSVCVCAQEGGNVSIQQGFGRKKARREFWAIFVVAAMSIKCRLLRFPLLLLSLYLSVSLIRVRSLQANIIPCDYRQANAIPFIKIRSIDECFMYKCVVALRYI